jgi:threonine/homoserine/homoserine lactone efflux protein
MITLLSVGIVLGLSSGFSPGPLLALIISQTLQHGIKEGIKVAIAPLITDFPILLLSLFVLSRLANFRSVLGVISLIGGLFVLKLAYENIRTKKLAIALQDTEPKSLSKGALVNALNPNPYLFWLTVGAPTIIKIWTESPFTAIMFVVGFLGCLVGAKIFVAALVGKSRHLLSDRIYGYLMRVLGVLLIVFAILLFKDGLDLLGFLCF